MLYNYIIFLSLENALQEVGTWCEICPIIAVESFLVHTPWGDGRVATRQTCIRGGCMNRLKLVSSKWRALLTTLDDGWMYTAGGDIQVPHAGRSTIEGENVRGGGGGRGGWRLFSLRLLRVFLRRRRIEVDDILTKYKQRMRGR